LNKSKDGEPFEDVFIWEIFFSIERALEGLLQNKFHSLVLISLM